MLEVDGPDDWKKRQAAINKRLEGVAKKSGSEIAKKISKQKEAQSDKGLDQNCSIISMLSMEAQDQLRSGNMSLKEVVKDLCEALEAMVDMKPDDEEKEGKDE